MPEVQQLVKVQTRKEYMDALGDMLIPPKEFHEGEERTAGRLTELKSYLIECNSPLTPSFTFGDSYAEISDTGLESIKILRIYNKKDSNSYPVEFYLDKSYDRYPVLHTNHRSDTTHPLVQRIVETADQQFDSAWLSTSILKSISEEKGNQHFGYGIEYEDIFQTIGKDDILPEDDIRLEVSGGLSDAVLDLTARDPNVSQKMGYESIKLGRGTAHRGVVDVLTFNGRFSVKKGKSIDDHIILVENVRDDYKNTVDEVEANWVFGEKNNGSGISVKGDAFEFIFKRHIEDWDRYLSRIFDAKWPFNMWGIKNKLGKGVYRIHCVDMHTGHPLNVEVTDNLFRVYLPKDSCGNAVLRLFVNLQRYFDSTVRCPQIIS